MLTPHSCACDPVRVGGEVCRACSLGALVPAQRMGEERLRVLSLNAGLLRLGVLGRTFLEVPFLEERLEALVAELSGMDVDVVCLQEVFSPSHRDLLVTALVSAFPHSARVDDRRRGLTNGLLTLSRLPLLSTSFTPFRSFSLSQRVFVQQGVLSVTVPFGGGEVSVLNLHTTAGGARSPESRSAERVRARQLAEVARLAPGPAVVCGDFNAGPEASPSNYESFLAAGFLDAASGLPGSSPGVTWDPGNPLNVSGHFVSCPPQRIDHVFLSAACSIVPVRSEVVFTDPCVPAGGGLVPLSDHYGVLVDLVPAPLPLAAPVEAAASTG